jgi:hypothetical protein
MRRGIQGAAIVARKAYEAYGWEVTPEIIDAFYATLKGCSFKTAMAAVESCFQHEGRIKPPSCSEVFGEMRRMSRAAAHESIALARPALPSGSIVWGKYRDGVPLTPEVFHRQVVEAKAKYPQLFNGSGFDMSGLTSAINDMLLRQRPMEPPRGEDPWAHGRYQPGEDSETEFNF